MQQLDHDAPTPVPRSVGHLNFLDGLRGLCALYVFVHHCWYEVYPLELHRQPVGRVLWLTGWMAYGHFAVDVFILLSGFCLMLPVLRNDGHLRGGTMSFFYRRARRILPPYYVALGFSLLLIHFLIGTPNGSHWDVAVPVTRRGLLANLLLLEDVQDRYQINHVFWSVAVEWKIYFLFPALVWAARKAGLPTVAAVTVAATFGVGEALHKWHGGRWDSVHVQYLGLFAIGMCGAWMATAPRPFGRAWPAVRATMVGTAVLAAAGLATAALRYGYARASLHFVVGDLAFAAVAGPLLVVAARRPASVLARGLSVRPLVWLGGISYSFYLVHAPLIQVVYRYLVLPWHRGPLAAVGLLCTIACPVVTAVAVAFHLAFERPFMSARLRRTQPSAVELPV